MKWSLQLEVYQRDKWTCVYCGYDASKSHDGWLRGNLCVDHFKPRKKGGTDEIENLVTACRSCNAHKGENWFPTLEAASRWLRLYREEMSCPFFEHHITNAGTIEGWKKRTG
jgi:5-methylcytosine-specific restriction endonuclease McrA